MALQVPRFFDSYFQLSRQTNQEHWALQRFDKRSRGKKHDVLKQLFTIFQPMCVIQIRIIFLFDFCQLIRIQEGVKSAQIA